MLNNWDYDLILDYYFRLNKVYSIIFIVDFKFQEGVVKKQV